MWDTKLPSGSGSSVELPASDRPPRGVMLEVTPWGAFAAGALLVSALGLAFVLGQRLPHLPQQNPDTPRGALRTIEAVRQTPPIRYDELPVDRGALK